MTRTIGIVGAGGMAGVHASAWRELGQTVAFHSPHGAEAIRQEGELDATSLGELLAACDVLDVCSPTPAHESAVRAAIAAGVPVVCEKPLALTVAAAEALAAEAEAAAVPLFPAHVLRYFGEYAAVKASLDGGELGRPAVAQFLRMGELPRWSRWITDDERSGGILQDQMIHDLDMAAWLFGPVRTVSAVQRRAEGGERVAHALLTHENGAVSSCTGVWGAAGLAFRTRFSVAGDRGRLEHDSDDTLTARFDAGTRGAASAQRPDAALSGDPYREQLADVLRALDEGGGTRTTAHEAAAAVRTARAAVDSALSGRPVDTEDAG